MRPLTDSEARRVRAHARSGIITTDLPLLVALGFAGASSTESATVTAANIDTARGFVRLPGHSARINPLDTWGRNEISFLLRNRDRVDSNGPLCVTPGLPLERAKHSVTVRLRRVLDLAKATAASRPDYHDKHDEDDKERKFKGFGVRSTRVQLISAVAPMEATWQIAQEFQEEIDAMRQGTKGRRPEYAAFDALV